jgi:hypothetical protein
MFAALEFLVNHGDANKVESRVDVAFREFRWGKRARVGESQATHPPSGEPSTAFSPALRATRSRRAHFGGFSI